MATASTGRKTSPLLYVRPRIILARLSLVRGFTRVTKSQRRDCALIVLQTSGYRGQQATQSAIRNPVFAYTLAALLRELSLDTGVRHGFVFESEILIEAANRGVHSVAVEIPAIYSDGLRTSHFRPVADITNITLMVGGRLIRRGLYLPGLYRSVIGPELRRRAPPGFDGDAFLALVLSILVAVLTLGVGFLWFLYRVHRTAAAAPTEVEVCDAVIVLGHQLNDGHISGTYRARLDRVLQLCRDHQTMDVHIAGGRSSEGFTEADAGYRYLISREVKADRLYRENLSSNTVENLKQMKPLFVALSASVGRLQSLPSRTRRVALRRHGHVTSRLWRRANIPIRQRVSAVRSRGVLSALVLGG